MVRTLLCPVPLALQQVLQQEVDQMLQMGITEESRSPWKSPTPVLVPKPADSVRVCIDFWYINAISSFDVYLLPQIEALLHRVGQAH